jgi:hypothetical protein
VIPTPLVNNVGGPDAGDCNRNEQHDLYLSLGLRIHRIEGAAAATRVLSQVD